MKRFFHLTSLAFLLFTTAYEARSFPGFCFLLAPADFKLLAPPVERVEPKPSAATLAKGASFVISTFDRNIITEFSKAWETAGNGVAPTESVLLILRNTDGSFSARSQGFTNEFKRFTFSWHPAAVAIVHTHPNGTDPRPQQDDVNLSNRLQVPIFTLTAKGMFVYDPFTKKTSIIQDGLDWLKPSKWEKEIALR